MMTFIATIHILACIALIVVAIMQDSKGGGMFASQTSSNSVLGATGGASLIVKVTKALAIIILLTCVSLAYLYNKSNKSVVDGSLMNGATTNTAAPKNETAPATEATPAQPAPAAPENK